MMPFRLLFHQIQVSKCLGLLSTPFYLGSTQPSVDEGQEEEVGGSGGTHPRPIFSRSAASTFWIVSLLLQSLTFSFR